MLAYTETELMMILATLEAELKLLQDDTGRIAYWYKGQINLLRKILGME